MSKLLITLGALIMLIGLLWPLIGKIPGDITVKKGHTTVYFPLMTSIIISLVLSVILFIIGKFR